ncbi:MAG: GAF domain-containing protein [Chloroflexi bacterium]|nr:GAF domain-containing protein [Chloroflexota bacterium]
MNLKIESSDLNQDNATDQDLRSRLLRYYLLFTGFMLLIALLLAQMMINRQRQEQQTAVSQHTQFIAQQIPHLPTDTDWLALTGLPPQAIILILNPDGETSQNIGTADVPNIPVYRAWHNDLIPQVLTVEAGSFISADPEGDQWLHTFATIPTDGRRLLIHQPTDVAFTAVDIIYQVWFIALLMFLAGGIFSWIILSHQIIQPLEQLSEYSGLIRWRGRVYSDEKENLDNLTHRPDQIGDLTRTLIAMEEDIDTRFLQLSILLETSRVVAASLDIAELLNNILDQVQNLFDVEYCAIVALDRRADVFRIRAHHGLSADYVQQLRIAPAEPNSPSMRALRNQTPIQVANTETDLAFVSLRPRARAEGYQSVLAIPLQTIHAAPAVLLLYKAAPYRYSYTELELASSFGHHASIAMENAELYARTDEQLQEQTRRLEAIVESLEDGLILEGVDGRVLYCNHQAALWLGMGRQVARRQTGAQLFNHILPATIDAEQIHEQYQTAVAGTGPRSFDLVYQPKHIPGRDLRIHLFDVTDVAGEIVGRGQLWQDISKDKELDRMKSALLSTVSHELRTPLATIKGYASTLLASDVEWNAAAQREFLQTISDETDRLATLVKNLLDLSRIEAGLLNIQREKYALNDLLQEVLHSFDPALNGRLHLNLTPNLPPVPMDISRISAVIRNLVENAFKYSPPEAPIDIVTGQENGRVIFTVRDYGPGIPPDLQDKIFDRFFRADNRLTRQVGGVGLGLAICKGFMAAHNGRVWVQPANPGVIFGFALPVEIGD